jgi:hypothetical protein
MLNAFSTDTQYTHALSGTQAEHHLAQDTAGLAEYTRQAAGQLEPETHLCECCEWARGCVKTPRGSRLLQIVQFDIVILKPDNPPALLDDQPSEIDGEPQESPAPPGFWTAGHPGRQ